MEEAHLTKKELLILANGWEDVCTNSSRQLGLLITQKFFKMFPEVMDRFEFAKDRYDPLFMESQTMRNHGQKLMEALDLGGDHYTFLKNSFFFGQALMFLFLSRFKPKNVLRGVRSYICT